MRSDVTMPLIAVLAILLVVYCVAVPLVYLFRHAADADAIRSALDEPFLGSTFRDTIVFAILACVVSLLIGGGTAFLVTRTDLPFKKTVTALLMVPIVIPGVLYAMSWVLMASPRIGLLDHYLNVTSFSSYSLIGMSIVQGMALAPLAFLTLLAPLRSLDVSLEEAASLHGATNWRTYRRITIPLIRPATLTTGVLLLALNIETFEIPAILGVPGNTYTFTTLIYRVMHQSPPKFGEASVLSMIVMVLLVAALLAQAYFTKHQRSFRTITGKAYRRSLIPLRRLRVPVFLVVGVYLLIATVLPILIVIYAGARSFYVVPDAQAMSQLDWSAYQTVLESPDVRNATWNTIQISLVVATVAILVAAVVAWVRYKSASPIARWLIDIACNVPLAIPGIVTGVALLGFYVDFPIPIYGTIVILMVGYFTGFIPLAVRYSETAMFQIGNELDEAAQVGGSTRLRAFGRVFLPLAFGGLLSGWIFLVIVSFRSLSTAVLLYSPGSKVLPVLVYEQWTNGVIPKAAAIGVIQLGMIAVFGLVAFALLRIGKWLGRRTTSSAAPTEPAAPGEQLPMEKVLV
ncbi:ABC transporter permease [Actinophytocola sp.]|uniref:ABC transporter permease n=1 Tax=Actinophytocola sp. TaxID=1872138 RepID=UPI003D6B7F30